MEVGGRTGRPAVRAVGGGVVGLSFRVDARLKNLLLDVAEGSGLSMRELLELLVLREAGLGSLDECDAC